MLKDKGELGGSCLSEAKGAAYRKAGWQERMLVPWGCRVVFGLVRTESVRWDVAGDKDSDKGKGQNLKGFLSHVGILDFVLKPWRATGRV